MQRKGWVPKRADFKGSGRRDAVVRHIGCGEPRQGRRGPATRVSPCPLKSALFREAAGHPVSRKAFLRLPLLNLAVGGTGAVGDQAQDFEHDRGGKMCGLLIGVILGRHQADHVATDDILAAYAAQ